MNQFDKHDKVLKGFFVAWFFILTAIITFWGLVAFVLFHFLHKIW
jgi:hypothetical protein